MSLQVMVERAARDKATAGTGAPAGPAVVLRGRVRQGVEPRSVVLHASDGRRYQLGGDFYHLSGHEVIVRGRVRDDLATTAQDGVVVEVGAVERTGQGVVAGPDGSDGPGA
ncbi:MAG: hypothetical protein CSA58_10540 [Micrococcales bacterium]|nr:MAG: hypothetical protein CSB46_01935 [Micrococcales bacterium]PIE26242.1 MAG: hypothetical protein CSA58_10540 [Micrococcales bacterium]